MFKWAFGDKANLKEPLEALKEQGWQYGDAPTASNFNWLFNKISSEFDEKVSKNFFEEKINNLNSDIRKIDDRSYSLLVAIQQLILVLNSIKDTGLEPHFPFNKKNPKNLSAD
jgi:hypothetical protein